MEQLCVFTGKGFVMKTFMIIVAALLFFCGTAADAAIRYVSQTGAGSYTLPSSAFTAAVAGDTILIGPGYFVEGSNISVNKRCVWIGAGWDQTNIYLSGVLFNFNSSAGSGTSIEGVRITSSSSSVCLYSTTNGADSITARRCLLVGGSGQNTVTWTSTSAGRLFLEDCILINYYQYANAMDGPRSGGVIRNCVLVSNITVSNGNGWAIGSANAYTGSLEVYNCTFLNWDDIFSMPAGSPAAVIINNAAYDFTGGTASWGTIAGSSVIDYNASPATPAAPGTNPLVIAANPFVNYDPAANYVIGTTDLHLVGGSNLIDGGNPGLLDVDGSRSDVGVYGGPRPLIDNGVPNYPWAVNIVNTPNVAGQGTPVNATAIGRVGPQ